MLSIQSRSAQSRRLPIISRRSLRPPAAIACRDSPHPRSDAFSYIVWLPRSPPRLARRTSVLRTVSRSSHSDSCTRALFGRAQSTTLSEWLPWVRCARVCQVCLLGGRPFKHAELEPALFFIEPSRASIAPRALRYHRRVPNCGTAVCEQVEEKNEDVARCKCVCCDASDVGFKRRRTYERAARMLSRARFLLSANSAFSPSHLRHFTALSHTPPPTQA